MIQVVIRRFGTIIDVSADGVLPPAPFVVALLSDSLVYTHKKQIRKRVGGRFTTTIQTETRKLHTLQEGRVTTSFGMLTKVVNLLNQYQVGYTYYDLSPPPERPDAYVADWENVRRFTSFRPRQEECLQTIANNQCGMIIAAPGFGKTYLFEQIAHLYPRAKIDIVVRPKDVAKDIVQRLTATIPNVGLVCTGSAASPSARVVVYTAGSAHHAPGDADILLCDEAHMLMTASTTQVLGGNWMFSRKYGFTATPDREDGGCAQLELFFGPRLFELPYADAVALGLVVPIHVRWLPIRLDHNPCEGKTGVPKLRWGIWRNNVRNAIIAADARRYAPDHQVLILCATLEHVIHLWRHLPEYTLCYGSQDEEQLASYQAANLLPDNFINVTPERRQQLKEAFRAGTLKKVIATGVWSTGVDFPALQTLYRVCTQDSMALNLQASARTSRVHEASAKNYGEVVDCYDFWDSGFRRKSDGRRRAYRKQGWTEEANFGARQIAHA